MVSNDGGDHYQCAGGIAMGSKVGLGLGLDLLMTFWRLSSRTSDDPTPT